MPPFRRMPRRSRTFSGAPVRLANREAKVVGLIPEPGRRAAGTRNPSAAGVESRDHGCAVSCLSLLFRDDLAASNSLVAAASERASTPGRSIHAPRRRARSGLPAARGAACSAARRNLADLVEEQRAAVGKFETADAVAQRAGEGASRVAEEFAPRRRGRLRRSGSRHCGSATPRPGSRWCWRVSPPGPRPASKPTTGWRCETQARAPDRRTARALQAAAAGRGHDGDADGLVRGDCGPPRRHPARRDHPRAEGCGLRLEHFRVARNRRF